MATTHDIGLQKTELLKVANELIHTISSIPMTDACRKFALEMVYMELSDDLRALDDQVVPKYNEEIFGK